MKKNWLVAGSIIFFLWGFINTFFAVSRYGIDQGVYWWYCNLALFVFGYGFLRKNTRVIIIWLSYAIFTQSFWVIDNIWRIISKRNLFGLVEFMYQPGYPMDEFLLSHYHYFAIPAGIMALLFIKRKSSNAKLASVFHGMIVLGISYFVFPPEQNINCAYESCFSFLEWKGPLYFAFFSFVIIFAAAIGAGFIERLHKKTAFNKRQKNVAKRLFVALIIVSVGLIFVDTLYKNTLPKFSCNKPFENNEVRAVCKYTLENEKNTMWLVYNIKNKQAVPKTCTISIIIDGERYIMHKNAYLGPNKQHSLGFSVPYPKKDATAELDVSCS